MNVRIVLDQITSGIVGQDGINVMIHLRFACHQPMLPPLLFHFGEITRVDQSPIGVHRHRADGIGPDDIVQRRAGNDQGGNPVRISPRVVHCHRCSLRKTDDGKAAVRDQLVYILKFPFQAGRCCRLTEAPPIRHHQPPRLRQRMLQPPHPPVESPAVQQQYGSARAEQRYGNLSVVDGDRNVCGLLGRHRRSRTFRINGQPQDPRGARRYWACGRRPASASARNARLSGVIR